MAQGLGPPGLGDILKNITLVFLASYVYCMQYMFLCVSLVSLDFSCLKDMNLVFVSVQKRVNIADLRLLLLKGLFARLALCWHLGILFSKCSVN